MPLTRLETINSTCQLKWVQSLLMDGFMCGRLLPPGGEAATAVGRHGHESCEGGSVRP